MNAHKKHVTFTCLLILSLLAVNVKGANGNPNGCHGTLKAVPDIKHGGTNKTITGEKRSPGDTGTILKSSNSECLQDQSSVASAADTNDDNDGLMGEILVFRTTPALKLIRKRREISWPWNMKTTPVPKQRPGEPDAILIEKQLKTLRDQTEKCHRDLIFTRTKIKLKSRTKKKGIKSPEPVRKRRWISRFASPPPPPGRPPQPIPNPTLTANSLSGDRMKQEVVVNKDKLSKCHMDLVSEKIKLKQIEKAQGRNKEAMARVKKPVRTRDETIHIKEEIKPYKHHSKSQHVKVSLTSTEDHPENTDDISQLRETLKHLEKKSQLAKDLHRNEIKDNKIKEKVEEIHHKLKAVKKIKRLKDELKHIHEKQHLGLQPPKR